MFSLVNDFDVFDELKVLKLGRQTLPFTLHTTLSLILLLFIGVSGIESQPIGASLESEGLSFF